MEKLRYAEMKPRQTYSRVLLPELAKPRPRLGLTFRVTALNNGAALGDGDGGTKRNVGVVLAREDVDLGFERLFHLVRGVCWGLLREWCVRY